MTIYDPAPVEVTDLGTQFFLRKEDIGKPRGQVTAPRLAELNSYVPIKLLEGEGEVTVDLVKNYQVSLHAIVEGQALIMQVVVLTNTSLAKQLEINEYCHANGIYFIAADVRGLFGYVFALCLARAHE